MSVNSTADDTGPPGAVLDQDTAEQAAAVHRRLRLSRAGSGLDHLAGLAVRLLGVTAAEVVLVTDVATVAASAGLPADAAGSLGEVAQLIAAQAAESAAPLVVPDARVDARTSALDQVSAGRLGAYLGVPLVTGRGVVGTLAAFNNSPRSWSDTDVSILEQLAASVVAELELAALATEFERSRARWQLAIEAAGIGSFDWDLVTGRLSWDDTCLAMFDYDRETFHESIADFRARLHADDLPHVNRAIADAIASVGTYEAEFRVMLPTGRVRWIQARGRALGGNRGAIRLLGAVADITAVREGQARVVRVLESIPAAFISLDRDGRVTYANSEAARVLDVPRQRLLGSDLGQHFPATRTGDLEASLLAAREHGQASVPEAYYPAPLDAWYEIRVWADDEGLSLYFHDVTERRAAQAYVDRVSARAVLLAEVTATVTGTLDPQEVAARLARLVVPELADWCLVSLVEGDGDPQVETRVRDVGSWHADPALRALVAQYAANRLPVAIEASLLGRVLRIGEPVVVRQGATQAVSRLLGAGTAHDLLVRLAPDAIAVVPIRSHGRMLGLITLFAAAESRRFTDEDIATARDAAARAALALDNARLYAQQRDLAEGLQRSLLTPPPQPDHLQLAVRYLSAAEAAQVGGDWYDAFQVADGATALVIGDVMGHDTAAAAAMGHVRGVLRGIAHSVREPPAAVLSALDRAMLELKVNSLATAVFAKVEVRSGAGRVLRWSNAGHPPPVLVRPDGTATLLVRQPDLLLGFDATAVRHDHEVDLPVGATVLFFTDGMIERRGVSLDDGLEWLRSTAATVAGLPLERLCDVLLDDIAGRLDDDIALLALRAHPEHPMWASGDDVREARR